MPPTTLAGNRKKSQENMAAGRSTQNRSASGSQSKSTTKTRRKGNESTFQFNEKDDEIPENMYRPTDEDDPEGWVHRDKLAKIESEELQAAGINLANSRRTTSRAMNRVATHEEKENIREEVEEQDKLGQPSTHHRVPASSQPSGSDPNQDHSVEHAADSQTQSNHVSRKSGSKIPIFATSANPIPADRLDREKPMPRRRTISNSLTPEETNMILNSPNRNGDDEAILSRTTTAQSRTTPRRASPSKNRSLSMADSPLNSGGRLATPVGRGASTTARNATPTSAQRPNTRSGDRDRPRTAMSRPEGDPPWVATMYKVDPMLPPDQQIIPTHARKLQQDQWQDEGAVPSAYDREFQPLSIHADRNLQRPPELDKLESEDNRSAKLSLPGKTSQHSLPRQQSRTSEKDETNSSTGYNPPQNMDNNTSMVQNISIIRPAPGTIRTNELEYREKGKKSKTCGCCVVM